MSKVYFTRITKDTSEEQIKNISESLLKHLVKEENISLEKEIPLKIHFGEKGNETYIKSLNYDGIIDYLQENGTSPFFIETTVLYSGQRHNKELLLKTAKEHEFNRIPVIVADGEVGEDFAEVKINKKHFKSCKIGKEFLKYKQLIVLSHFKGHAMAGFGGAIKQLSMGCASKGGKLAMHMGVKPQISNRKCKKCNLCKTRCNVNAITIGEKSFINHDKCIGCGACYTICPYKAISIMSLKGIITALFQGNKFKEKLVEYAYAAALNKNNIYINFAINITKGCDCEPRKMKPVMDDFGIFASIDPVAIDKACLDMALKNGKAFKDGGQLAYAEQIGLGSLKYELIEI